MSSVVIGESTQESWAQPISQSTSETQEESSTSKTEVIGSISTSSTQEAKKSPKPETLQQTQKTEAQKKTKRPPIKRLDQDRLQVGEVLLNRKTRRIEVPAEVNMTRGILEYYGVCPDGKTHESVLKIKAVPSHIHLALILAGYEPSEYGKSDPKSFRRTQIKRGSLLRLYVRWRPIGFDREQWIPASAWIFDRNSDAPPKPHPYTFEGSLINSNGYAADMELSVIGLIDDPTVVLAPTIDQGNPYQGERLGFEIYSSAIPPKGTPVTLVIQAATDQEIKEVAHYEEELEELAQLKRRKILKRDKLRPLPPPPPFELMLHLDARSQLTYRSKSPR
jgi:hypothetical protein